MKMCRPALSATVGSLSLSCTVDGFCLWSKLKWLYIVRNPDNNVDLCPYRKNVRPVMATLLVMAQLTSFYIYNSMCIIIEELMCMFGLQKGDQNLTLPDCLLWPHNVCILTT